MALLNILPTWVTAVGRDLIRNLAGLPDPPPVALAHAEEEPAALIHTGGRRP